MNVRKAGIIAGLERLGLGRGACTWSRSEER